MSDQDRPSSLSSETPVHHDGLSADDWESRYQNNQAGWDRGQPSPQLHRWLASGLSSPGSVLIPGCGNGHEALTLAEQGHDVTAVDFAASPIRRLRDRAAELSLSIRVIQSDVFLFETEQPFDWIYEQTCLCAIHPSQRRDYEQRLHSWLRQGGNLLALFMQNPEPNGPPWHCSLEQMQMLFPSSRWDWQLADNIVPHPTGLHEIPAILTKK